MIRPHLLALSAACTLLAAAPAGAQEPPRRPVRDTLAQRDTLALDTLAVDTMPLAPDTAAADTVPPPLFSDILGAPPPGVAATTFRWDREALLREAALTLGDLLEHLPGFTVIRAGLFLQPEAVSALGQSRGRTEIVLDGFVLDPLTTSTLDLAGLELAQLQELRIERRLDLTRIHLTSIEPRHAQVYSRIEAGTGEPSGSIFRGSFTTPRLFGGPLAFAVDRLDGNGREGAEPANILAIWGKWGWFPSPDRALQVEFRQSNLERTGGVPWAGEQSRRDLILRARSRLGAGIAAEVFAGQSSVSRPPPDTAASDSIATLERSAWQYGVRATFRQPFAWLDGELRFRDSDALPGRQLDLAGGLELGSRAHVAGSLTSAAWADGPGAQSWNVRAELGPAAGFSAFAELADGDRGAPLWGDSAGTSTIETRALEARAGSRFGVSFRRFGIEATGALVRVEQDSAAPFGLPFDEAFGRTIGRQAQGLEVYGRLPLWPRGLSFTGNFNYWDETGGLLYLPSRSWRLAAEVHTLPLPSGNLEVLARFEHQRREAMLERNPESLDPTDPDNPPSSYVVMPIRNLFNGYLQIRVIDVRAFIHWYDVLGGGREDLPGRTSPGPRILYGVKWQLFN